MRSVQLHQPKRLLGRRLLKRWEFERIVLADDVLQKTNEELARLTLEHEKELEKERATAKREAYRKAFGEFVDSIAQIHASLEQMHSSLDERFRIALQRILEDQPMEDVLGTAIKTAIDGCIGDGTITICAHPENIDAIEAKLGNYFAERMPQQIIRFEPDPDISREQGLVFSQREVFDVGISAVVDVLVDSFGPGMNR